ncbi:hypothetical protein, partial [Escherichia coli]
MMTINNARKILQRVDTLPLYLHAYAGNDSNLLIVFYVQ